MAMRSRSSTGSLGCRRIDSRPGRPIVFRKRVTTRHFAATAIRSWLRISFETAAAISGMTPGAKRCRVAVSVSVASSQSRKPPTVRCATGAKAPASCVSTMRRVTSSSSYGMTDSSRKRRSGRSARQRRAATRSSADPAATPASTSPDRSGDAFARTSFRSRKVHVVSPIAWRRGMRRTIAHSPPRGQAARVRCAGS